MEQGGQREEYVGGWGTQGKSSLLNLQSLGSLRDIPVELSGRQDVNPELRKVPDGERHLKMQMEFEPVGMGVITESVS